MSYDSFYFASRKSSANVKKVHLQSQRVSEAESRCRVFDCLRKDVILQAANADMESNSFDVQAQLFCFAQQKFAVLARHAAEFLAEPDFVCWFRVEAQTKKKPKC